MQELTLEEIQRRARKGPMLLLIRRGASLVITLLTTVVIARLLTPRAYGLAAMSSVVLSFVQVFRDFGLTNAMLRKGSVSEEEVNFLFWFNLMVTLGMATAIGLAAPAIAAFYGEPIIATTLWVSLSGFIVSGAAMQFAAVLKRELRFDVVAGAETAAALMALIIGAVLAYYLRNVWALVAMNITYAVTQSTTYFLATRWRPARFRPLPGAGELLRFGANSSIFSGLNFFSKNGATLIIGQVLGSSSLGFFNRANALYLLPLSNLLEPLAQAALPVMARLRPHPQLYRETYLGLIERMSCVLVPTAAFVFAAAGPIVLTLLGNKWGTSAVLLAALAPSLAIYGLFYPTSDLLISQNRSQELRTSGIYDMALRVGGILIGAQFGLVPAAVGLAVGTISTVPIRINIAGRSGPISQADHYKAFLPSLPLGLAVLAAVEAVKPILTKFQVTSPVALIVASVAAGAGSLLSAALVPATRRSLLSVVATLTGRYQPIRGS